MVKEKKASKLIINSSGQVALIVLLVSAVVLALGLSAARKTVVDTKTETDQQQLKQAFNAAESGIEYYLGTGGTTFNSPDNVSKANIQVQTVGNGTTVNFDQFVVANTNLEFWLVGHNADGSIDYGNYYAGNSLGLCVDKNFNGALAINYFYRNGANYKVTRYGYNLSAGYVGGYQDLSPLQGNCTSNYREVVLTTPLAGNVPLLLSVKALRSGTRIYLHGDGALFPVQGIELNSTGVVTGVNTSTGVNRTLSVFRTYEVPGFALDAITTFGNVLSN